MPLKRIVHTLLSTILLVIGGEALAEEPTYRKATSLPPLRITYNQLQSVLDKSATLIAAANSSLPISEFSERSQLKHGESQIVVPGHQLLGSDVKLPKLATELRYSAYCYHRESVPISTVSMSFNDLERRLEVEGGSPEQVDAVFASLKSDFLSMSSPMGGMHFRLVAGNIVACYCVLAVLFGLPKGLTTRDHKAWIPVVLACLGICLLFALPFSEFLAGFSVSEFDPDFARRYASEISMVTFVVSVVLSLLPYLSPKWSKKRPVPDSPREHAPPNPPP